MEVYYRYHPYFGCKVLVRRVEQRATGQFFNVQGPEGMVISISGWMLDPVICAGMTTGAPRVELAALVELKRLLMPTLSSAHSPSDVVIVGEEGNKSLRLPAAALSRQMNLLFDTRRLEGMTSVERDKIVKVEELDDDRR